MQHCWFPTLHWPVYEQNELSLDDAGVKKHTGVAAVRVAKAKARMVAAQRANMVKMLEGKVD